MLTVALKGIAGHKGRVVSTAVAVLLGVGFTTGALLFTDTLATAFDDLFASIYEDTDAVIRGDRTVGGDFGPDDRNTLDASVAAVVAGVPGVAEIGVEIEHPETYVVADDGDPIVPQAPAFGRVWTSDDSPFNPFVLQPGSRDPTGPDEIVLDKATADRAGYDVGDTVPVLTPNVGRVEYTLAGVAKFGTADGTLAATQVLFTLEEAQRVLGEPGRIDQVSATAEGISDTDLVARLAVALDAAGVDDVEVLTGADIVEEDQSEVAQFTDILRGAMLGFASIAMLVGAFIIYNTFSILIAQRGRELALLRAIGASRRQVVRSVLIEALVVGVGASLIGVGAGFGLAAGLVALFDALGFGAPIDGFVVSPVTLVFPFVVGVVVTVGSALLPAFRAARISPVAAMREVAVDDTASSPWRGRVGLVLAVLGVVATLAGLGGAGLGAAALGAVAVIVAAVVGGPVIAVPISGVLGLPFQRSTTGQMARQNAMRNPRRTASTALALTIGVTLVVIVTILGASFKKSFAGVIEDQFTGDLVVDSGSFGFAGFDPSIADALRQRDDVVLATGLRVTPAIISGPGASPDTGPQQRDLFLQAVDAADAARLFDLGGSVDELAALGPDDVAISRSTAEDTGWQVGTVLGVDFLQAGEVSLEVATIYEAEELADELFVDTSVLDAVLTETFDLSIFLELADDATPAQTADEIEAFLEADYPIATVKDGASFAEDQSSFIDGLLQLMTMLLAFSVLIAGIGIGNTLSLSTFERRRELGLLRAVGMTRAQVRRSIRIESVIVALLGVAIGVGLGVFFGSAIVLSADDDAFLLALAPGQLAIIVVAGIVLGVVAAWRPARRAAKLDILDAIAVE